MQAQQLDLDLAAAVLQVVGGGPERCEAVLHGVCPRCGHRSTMRAVCPVSCDACARKGEARARRLRRLLPAVPLRHWTLTLPSPLRESIDADDPRVKQLVRAFVDQIFAWYRAVLGVVGDASCGAVVVAHRLGTALDRNLHLHVVALDGAFLPSGPGQRFAAVSEGPSTQHLGQIASGVKAALGQSASSRRTPVSQTSGTRRVQGARTKKRASGSSSGRRVSLQGIGVYAGTPVERSDGPGIIRLTRYLARPELDAQSLRPGGDDRVVYRLRRPGRDGASHVAIPTPELTRRLASLGAEVGRFRYYGVLAPAASERWRAIPTQLCLVDGKRVPGGKPRSTGWLCPKCEVPMEVVAVEERLGAEPREACFARRQEAQ